MTDLAFGVIGIAASLGAAALWLRASLLEVPDNIDNFIGELQRIGRWNAWAAGAACIAALCAAYAFARQLGWL